MSELFGEVVWLGALVVFLAVIGIASYAISKIGTRVTGQAVEIDTVYYWGGAFVGMLFLPSGGHPTTESRLMLGAAIVAGAFFGGLAGLLVRVYSLQKASSNSGSTSGEKPNLVQRSNKSAAYMGGRLVIAALLVICGTVFMMVRFGELPFLSPLIRFLRNFL